MKSGLPPHRAGILYLGHNASAVLVGGPEGITVIEEEKEIRRNGGEYLPIRTALALRRHPVDAWYVVNFLGDVDYEGILMALFRGDRGAAERFLAWSPVYEVMAGHHDLHAVHALADALAHGASGPFHVLVNDGTGTNYEATTVYAAELAPGGDLAATLRTVRVVEKIPAANFSLGLLFGRLVCNADTGFAVLKDEHKSLGYEARIGEILPAGRRARVDRILERCARSLVAGTPHHLFRQFRADLTALLGDGMGAETQRHPPFTIPTARPVAIDFSRLERGESRRFSLLELARHRLLALRPNTGHQHFAHGLSVKEFQRLSREALGAPAPLRPWLAGLDRDAKRILLSYLANGLVVRACRHLVRRHGMHDVIVGGGVHFNVRANYQILDAVSGRFCAAPLAGDICQAAAAAAGLFPLAGRALSDLRRLPRRGSPPPPAEGPAPVRIGATEEELPRLVAEALAADRIVNLVKGRGELGPRALLNTSTLALPTEANRRRINQFNGRDDSMPMAPVLRRRHLPAFFLAEEYERVIGSLHAMILALRYAEYVDPQRYGGVMHRAIDGAFYTGRPQVVDPGEILDNRILEAGEVATGFLAFINTSFNVHGRATALHWSHAEMDHRFQCKRARQLGLPPPILIAFP